MFTSFSFLQVYIEIENENDNVPLTEQPVYYPHVPENSPPGTRIIRLNATDDDIDLNHKISYRIISGNPEGFFAIDSSTGKIDIWHTWIYAILPLLHSNADSTSHFTILRLLFLYMFNSSSSSSLVATMECVEIHFQALVYHIFENQEWNIVNMFNVILVCSSSNVWIWNLHCEETFFHHKFKLAVIHL